jgi:type IV pilus assembly protein PilA
MRKQKGFSLIELLIVVAIILIIAAIAIPSLLRSRIAANDSAAASSLRTINTAEITFSSSYPTAGFSQDLKFLASNGAVCTTAASVTSTSACLIDDTLGCGTSTAAGCAKSGFHYFVTAGTAPPGPPNGDYVISASPISLGFSGDKNYCSLPDAVIRQTTPGTAAVLLAAPETAGNCITPGTYAPIQ